ncbi:MAG: hybrid sensor histidine kinase/response regulator transcription factor [Flavobacterium sp.]
MKAKFKFFGIILLILAACNSAPEKMPASISSVKNSKDRTLQNQDLKFSAEQLDNTAGLSNSSVNCIFQDSQNLLWIGTWDGLNRYDGTSFKIFRPQPGKNSLSNQVVLKIGEGRNGVIWILTMHGINAYDKKTNTFRHFYFASENKPPVSELQFNIAFDGNKNVYCAVKDWGIGYFDGHDFQLLTKSLSSKNIRKFESADSGSLYAQTDDNMLYRVTISSERDKKTTDVVKIKENVSTFHKIAVNKINVVSNSGDVSILNGVSEIPAPHINGVGNIFGQIETGLLYSGKSGYFIADASENITKGLWLKHLDNHKITTVIQGNEGIIWAGTDGDGILKIFPRKKSFSLVSRAQLPELDGGIVRTFLRDSLQNMWVGTKGKGLLRLSADFFIRPDQKIAYTHFDENSGLVNNSVYALCNGNANSVLIGTDGLGITVYDTRAKKIINWAEIEGSKGCDYFKSVYTIFQDIDGYNWLGTNGYGMIRLKLSKNKSGYKIDAFKRYTAGNGKPNSLSSNIIFSIIPKDDDQLWIGTRLGGLNLFDKKSGKFSSYKHDRNDSQTLSSDDILCMATDSDKRLWVGTSYGLNTLQELKDGKANFKSYTVKDGLPNNTIHGIVPVKSSNLWISTNSGLSNFTLTEAKFVNYTRNDGLQNNEFADGAFYSDKSSGLIFMGGIKGFNYFLPEKINESDVMPDLLIDEISGQNQSVPYFQGLVISPGQKTHPAITLKHNQNFFDIHLRALTFTNSEKCQYAYRLEGFDKSWNNIGNRQIFSLTNVPKGKYSLLLKWTNSEGVWTQPVHAVDITVRAVWWQSTVALIIYFILAISFLLFVRSYNLKRRSLEQNILIRQKEEELHENKLTFFTNIAHEFLTPLTLIVGPAQKLADAANFEGKNSKYMHMIQRNASRLLFLTQQLLEFRKAEHDHLQNSVKNFDLTGLIEQIAELFDDWALDKNIHYTLDLPPTLDGWYDKDKLEKIIFNLMSNAFKYTPKGGSIRITCAIEDKKFKTLNITVKNTGKGIPKEKLDSLFDRFFLSDIAGNTDTEMFRTGIGLSYVKRLVTVMRGEIIVNSEPDAETVFTILIPCEKAAFSEKETDTEKTPVFISQHLTNILEETPEKADFVPEKVLNIDAVENRKKKILIAEDESEIHAYLKYLLAEKYEVAAAANGLEALEMIKAGMPDLIISDVMMPEMDGVELCREIKTNIETCHIPFIMLTAKSSVIHRIEGLESGANSYIPKPFYPDHLLVRIQKLLEEKELIARHFAQDTLVDHLPEIPIDSDEKAFIKSIIEIVRKNIDAENLDGKYIEKTLGLSESQLYRKTKEIFGLPPGDLIRTIRLKYAAELLRKNELTVSEICYKSGFNNRSYFYREFKKLYDTTPKNYQIHYKSRKVLHSK